MGGNLSNSGTLQIAHLTSVFVTGNLDNFGSLVTNFNDNVDPANPNLVLVSGNLTNHAGGLLNVGGGFSDSGGDAVSVSGTFSNSGDLRISSGASLSANGPSSGVTDVVSGSTYQIQGTFTINSANAFANLQSVEGDLLLWNGQSTSATPGSGTLTTGANTNALIDLEDGTTLTINGNVHNQGNGSNSSGFISTNDFNHQGAASTLTITGTLTNDSGAVLCLGCASPAGNTSADVANIGTLTNNGFVIIGANTTLNLTNQPNGLTDIAAGSDVRVFGSFFANGVTTSLSALANLATVEGTLELYNGQNLAYNTITPTGGTLTLNNTGFINVEYGTAVQISGSVTNGGTVSTNGFNNVVGPNTLTVTGTFTNNNQLIVGRFDDTTDVANINTIANSAFVNVGHGATLNLTNALPNTIGATETWVMSGTLNNGVNGTNNWGGLNTVSGILQIGNGASNNSITPSGGTLAVNGGPGEYLNVQSAFGSTTLTINGNVNNSGEVDTNRTNNIATSAFNTLNVTGTFTNSGSMSDGSTLPPMWPTSLRW